MRNAVLKPETIDHINALDALGLNTGDFASIAKRILQAYTSTTGNDAKMAPGMASFLAAVRAVRDVLAPRGWKGTVEHHLELATNEELALNILVSSGNRFIGCEDGYPGNKNPKGRNTQRMVFINMKQMKMFPEASKKNEIDSASNVTYFLFYHFDLKKMEMRMELSLPTSFNLSEKRVEGWAKRIFLKPISFEGTEVKDLTPDSFTPEIDFEVPRKSHES